MLRDPTVLERQTGDFKRDVRKDDVYAAKKGKESLDWVAKG
jgi:hypothetical protein